ncbi:MAG: hypothetical protein F6J93_34340 [Oscillatoria sp. SIO1A7]|nr:hypothetical protein [Oscillatoria sp. SIO1A7]
MLIGCAVNNKDLKKLNFLSQNFNAFALMNQLKPNLTSLGEYQSAQEAIAQINKYTKNIRGSCILWHRNLPVFSLNNSKKFYSWLESLFEFSNQNNLNKWDILNEAIADNGFLRSIWHEYNIIFEAIKTANKYNIKTYYCDYRVHIKSKQEGILELLMSLKKHGLHGFSLQIHYTAERFLLVADRIANFISRIQFMGLEVDISEVTLWNKTGFKPIQVMAYEKLAKLALNANIKTIIFWGYSDRSVWRHPEYRPHPFDLENRPKQCWVNFNRALNISA